MPLRFVIVPLVLLAVVVSSAPAQLPPEKALATMQAGDGLQVELFAHEPMLINPTAIDVDHKGRVWVAEAVNYRRVNFKRPILREEGDRIVVLTDSNGDGKADKSTVFYQGKDLYGPLSVLVLPQADGKSLRVLVAQSPNILEFWDRDGDLKADGPPSQFLTGFGGFDHDHGVHGLTTGPDGKLYFTVGDSGVTGLQSKDGKGRKWETNRSDCQAGTVWRCDLDGNNLELIAHNFRNNYEPCVDSFGEIWLSDNDDDGNEQTRICFVMPGGNYGYWPRGAGQTHWHEEQPGVVHKVLRTGFGSPTGICFYEGNLLPEKYRGDLIHADAGPREIRYFKRKPQGAGYELEKMPMLTSTDNWFRPSDVCVAPDGSIFVADWYDPGVGGHGMGDWTRGRIYRITPKGHTGYKVPEIKLDTKEGALAALGSPSTCVRSLVAATRMENKLDDSNGLLSYLVAKEKFPSTNASDSILLARLRWLSVESVKDVLKNSRDAQAALAIFTIVAGNVSLAEEERNALVGQIPRVYRLLFMQADPINRLSPDTIKLLQLLPTALTQDRAPTDHPPAFQREVILFLANHSAADVQQHFYEFAKRYDGQDHFYRAALNIACGNDSQRRDAILADFEKQFPEWNDKVANLVWELRPKSMLPRMEQLLNDDKLTPQQKGRIVDIIAVNESEDAGQRLLNLLRTPQPAEVSARVLENLQLFLPTKWKGLRQSEELKSLAQELLNKPQTMIVGLRLIAVSNAGNHAKMVSAILLNKQSSPEIRLEALSTLARVRSRESVKALVEVMTEPSDPLATAAVSALGKQISGQGNDEISKLALQALQEKLSKLDDQKAVLGQAILSAMAGSRPGTQWLLQQKEAGKLPETLIADAGRLLRNSPFQGERNKAMILFPAPGKLNPKKLPAISELARRTGNADNGKQIMARSLTGETQCLKCHMVRGIGGQIGPDLSMIGKKGSAENLFESILYPSKAIADQSVSWKIDTIDGLSLTGLIVQENETSLTLRDANGKDYPIPVKDIEKRSKSLVSLMPEDLIATLNEDELVDLVAYLMTLRTAAYTPTRWHIAGPFPSPGGNAGLDEKVPAESTDFSAWKTVTPTSQGYVDLRLAHGEKATNSISVLRVEVESPAEQPATILLGTDDGARVFLNGKPVFQTDATRAAAPEQDQVNVTLVKGKNTILLKIATGDGPHGFYFTIVSEQELKGK